MEVQLDDIAGGKPLLGQGGEEQFVDDTRACHAHWALFRGHRDEWRQSRGRASPRAPPGFGGNHTGCAPSDFRDAAGTDQVAGAAVPQSADDRAGGSLCHG